MKYILLLILSLNVFAENWVPVSKIQSGSQQAYQLEKECIARSGEQCLDIGDDPEMLQMGFIQLQDNYLKINEQSCLNQADCDQKFEDLVCSISDYEKIKNIDLLQVYCVKLDGKKIVKDQSGYNSAKSIVVAEKSVRSLIKKYRSCGSEVIDELIYRNNALKSLTNGQKKQVLNAYSEIKGLLEVGNLSQAKIEIQAVNADGILVTQADKDALIAKIDSCL